MFSRSSGNGAPPAAKRDENEHEASELTQEKAKIARSLLKEKYSGGKLVRSAQERRCVRSLLHSYFSPFLFLFFHFHFINASHITRKCNAVHVVMCM